MGRRLRRGSACLWAIAALTLAACEVSDITPPPVARDTATPARPTAMATPLPTRLRAARTPEPLATTAPPTPLPVRPSPGGDWNAASPDPLEGAGDILRADSFGQNLGWDVGTSEYGVIAISGGMLHVSVTNPRSYLRTLWDQPPVKNVYTAITARPSLCAGRDEYALLFNLVDANNYYRFSLTCDGHAQVAKTVGGVTQPLRDWTATSAYSPGAPGEARLAVWAFEGRMRFFVNGLHLFSLADATFGGGTTGVFVRSAESGNTSVSFDDLVIRELKP